MMDVIFPVSSVGRGLNNSRKKVQEKGLVTGAAPLLMSVQLKQTKNNCTSNFAMACKQQCQIKLRHPVRDLPIRPEQLLWNGLWMVQGPFLQRSASPHISTSCLDGNISGEDVRNPFLPKALMTRRDCWHVHFDSWMWQSPLLQRLQEKERAVQQLTESATLSLYHLWKLNNWPGELRMCISDSLHYSIKL